MSKIFYKLFANCIIVKGACRATICDIQRNRFQLVPLSFFYLFNEDNLIDLEKLKLEIDNENLPILNEYMELLVKNEFIFELSQEESNLFPNLSMEFDYPSIISNMIIDYNKNSFHNFQKILNDFIIPTNCRHIQFRFFDEVILN
ncbi:hypothetical protein, partial [Flavobacterium sp. 9AF]|uniref:hypothetical protein n=1 Tax=Flavobacterium sp. 9AF TaxID=2653142 RepID=UPI001356B4AE